jgi:hypothetical protein
MVVCNAAFPTFIGFEYCTYMLIKMEAYFNKLASFSGI